MIKRDIYLNRLINFKDFTELIKVVTGVRRCGKSTLLNLFEEYLLNNGVKSERIIRVNFEMAEFSDIKAWRELYDYIKARVHELETNYIILDEVQDVDEWERAVSSLYAEGISTDIYITGSNANMLASELATKLSGRYVEIKMHTLSFKEYLDYTGEGDVSTQFEAYITSGGFPIAVKASENDRNSVLQGVYDTIILRDVIQRNSVENPFILESILRYAISNIGSILSSKKISDTLTSKGLKGVTVNVIEDYLKMLEKAYILYRADRYDLEGKDIMYAPGKYYLVDTGFRSLLLSGKKRDYGHIYENIVYFELLRRGYKVFIGNMGDLEVDFVASKDRIITYYQISASILDQATLDRELRPLEQIKDNYEKIVLSLDRLPKGDDNWDGIKHRNLFQFLLSEN